MRGFLISRGDLILRIAEEIEIFEKGQNMKVEFFQKLAKPFLSRIIRVIWNGAKGYVL